MQRFQMLAVRFYKTWRLTPDRMTFSPQMNIWILLKKQHKRLSNGRIWPNLNLRLIEDKIIGLQSTPNREPMREQSFITIISTIDELKFTFTWV